MPENTDNPYDLNTQYNVDEKSWKEIYGANWPHPTVAALSSGGLGGIGDWMASKSGRDRKSWQTLFDPLDLLMLGDPVQTPLQKALQDIGSARFDNPEIQSPFLPRALQTQNINPYLVQGMQNLGGLIQNPGGTSEWLQGNIASRLGAEKQNIAQSMAGTRSEVSGSAARSNTPVSLKNALSSALDTAQARANRQAEQQAVSESEQLRRQDIPQTFNLLDTILQYVSSGRGQAVQGLKGAGQLDLQSRGMQQQQTAGVMAGLGSLAGSLSGVNWGGNATNNTNANSWQQAFPNGPA